MPALTWTQNACIMIEWSTVPTSATEVKLPLVSGYLEECLEEVFPQSLLSVGSVQPKISCVSCVLTQPPSSAPSIKVYQFSRPFCAGFCQPLSAFSVGSIMCCWSTLDLPDPRTVLVRGSPVSASSHRASDSTSALRPNSFTLAQRSLCSTTDCHPWGSTGLPRPSNLTSFHRLSGPTLGFWLCPVVVFPWFAFIIKGFVFLSHSSLCATLLQLCVMHIRQNPIQSL